MAFALVLGAATIFGCETASTHPPPAEEPVTASGDSHFPEAHTLGPSETTSSPGTMPVSMDGPSPAAAATAGSESPSDAPQPTAAAAPGGDLQGKAAPDLTVGALGKSKVPSIASLKGKVVVVHFWASWCTPCAKAIADLNAFAAKNKKKGVVVIGVSVDDDTASAAAFAKKTSAKFPMVLDTAKQTAGAYNVTTMPSTYVIDRKGNVVDVLRGAPIDMSALAKRL